MMMLSIKNTKKVTIFIENRRQLAQIDTPILFVHQKVVFFGLCAHSIGAENPKKSVERGGGRLSKAKNGAKRG